jgi:hypothetical protein
MAISLTPRLVSCHPVYFGAASKGWAMAYDLVRPLGTIALASASRKAHVMCSPVVASSHLPCESQSGPRRRSAAGASVGSPVKVAGCNWTLRV